MFIVDSHCHLNFPELQQNLDDILLRADKANVKVMQTICTKLSEFEEIKNISSKYKNVFCSVGVHPNDVSTDGIPTVEKLVELIKSYHKVIGIGETGLDYHYENSARDIQKQSFLNHIEASRITGLPVIIHSRNADEDMEELLRAEMNKKPFKALMHCFSSTDKLAQASIELGIYISISGIVTFKNAHELREIVRNVPMERLLVETDAPYLAPEPMRGKKNEPSFTKHTVDYLADFLGKSSAEIAYITTNNFFELFKCDALRTYMEMNK